MIQFLNIKIVHEKGIIIFLNHFYLIIIQFVDSPFYLILLLLLLYLHPCSITLVFFKLDVYEFNFLMLHVIDLLCTV